MYLEMINAYETAKASVSELATVLASTTNAEEKAKLKKDLEKAQKEVSDLYTKIKGVEVTSEFIIGSVIQGDDKSRITLNVAPDNNVSFPSFDEKGNEVDANKFGIASRWFLSLTAPICPASRLIVAQTSDITKTLKASLFSVFNGATINVTRKIALKGEKRRIGEGVYTSNQFYVERINNLVVSLNTSNEFDMLNFEMWKATLLNPYNEKQTNTAVNSLFRLS